MISPLLSGVLGATDQIDTEEIDKYVLMGELSLDGGLRPIKGACLLLFKPEKKNSKGDITQRKCARGSNCK